MAQNLVTNIVMIMCSFDFTKSTKILALKNNYGAMYAVVFEQ